jgi:hypothetical protein
MSVQLAPRPKNEERRVAAVKRTGIIDSDQSENFSVFCEIAKALTNFDRVRFSYLMKHSNAISPAQELTKIEMVRVNVTNLMFALMFY